MLALAVVLLPTTPDYLAAQPFGVLDTGDNRIGAYYEYSHRELNLESRRSNGAASTGSKESARNDLPLRVVVNGGAHQMGEAAARSHVEETC